MGIDIKVRKFGYVSEEELDHIISVIKDCYERIGRGKRLELDLYVFPDSKSAISFMNREKEALGVVSSEFGHRFLATHDAWRGRPRIMLRMDALRKVQPLVREGCLRHEVGHSILHGSPEYYRFPIPSSLLSLGVEFGLSIKSLYNILYLISVSVKDYEVTRLLVNNGFVEDQVAYVSYLLEPDLEDLRAYEMARTSREGMALYLTSIVRLIGCCAPLIREGSYRKDVLERLNLRLAHLPNEIRIRLFEVGIGGMLLLGEDTFSNVNFISDLLTRTILRHILSNRGFDAN